MYICPAFLSFWQPLGRTQGGPFCVQWHYEFEPVMIFHDQTDLPHTLWIQLSGLGRKYSSQTKLACYRNSVTKYYMPRHAWQFLPVSTDWADW